MAEKYKWDKFYPDHCDDKAVEMMIRGGISLVGAREIESGELIEALMELEKDSNRKKVLTDLVKDGYVVTEEDILDYLNMEGEGDIFNELINLFTGKFSKGGILEVYATGIEVPISDILKKCPENIDFYEDEFLEILNSVDKRDAFGINELLSRYNPGKIDKETVAEICELVGNDAKESVKKYLKLLSSKDRVEISEEFGIEI